MHSGYASSLRGTDTAEVEGLWLVNKPKHFVPEYPGDSTAAAVAPKVQLCSTFIVPSLYSMRDPHDVI